MECGCLSRLPPSLLPPFLITRLPPRKYCSFLPSPGIFMGHARLRLRGRGGEGTHYRLNQFGRHKAAMPLPSDRTKEGRPRPAAGTSPFPITTRRESAQGLSSAINTASNGLPKRSPELDTRQTHHAAYISPNSSGTGTDTDPAAQSMTMPEGNWNMPSTTHTLPTSLVPVSAYIHIVGVGDGGCGEP